MGVATINIILTILWAAVAIVLLLTPQVLQGQPWAEGLLANRMVLGGVAVVLVVYNLVRMQSLRAFERDREAIHEAADERRRLEDEHEQEPTKPHNPAFNFEEPSPKPPGERPPSSN